MTELLIKTSGYSCSQAEMKKKATIINLKSHPIRWLVSTDKIGFVGDETRANQVLLIGHNLETHNARVFVLGGEYHFNDGTTIRIPVDTTPEERTVVKFILNTDFPGIIDVPLTKAKPKPKPMKAIIYTEE